MTGRSAVLRACVCVWAALVACQLPITTAAASEVARSDKGFANLVADVLGVAARGRLAVTRVTQLARRKRRKKRLHKCKAVDFADNAFCAAVIPQEHKHFTTDKQVQANTPKGVHDALSAVFTDTKWAGKNLLTSRCTAALKKYACYSVLPPCRRRHIFPPCRSLEEACVDFPGVFNALHKQLLKHEHPSRFHLHFRRAPSSPFPTAACAGGTRYLITMAGTPYTDKKGNDICMEGDAVSLYNIARGAVVGKLGSTPFPKDNIFLWAPHGKLAANATISASLIGRGTPTVLSPEIAKDMRYDYTGKSVRPHVLRAFAMGDDAYGRPFLSTWEDTVIFYLTTHGSKPMVGTMLHTHTWAAFSGTRDNVLTGHALRPADFRKIVKSMQFDRMLMYLDFCFSRGLVVESFSRARHINPSTREISNLEKLFKKRRVLAFVSSWETETTIFSEHQVTPSSWVCRGHFMTSILEDLLSSGKMSQPMSAHKVAVRRRSRELDQQMLNELQGKVKVFNAQKSLVAATFKILNDTRDAGHFDRTVLSDKSSTGQFSAVMLLLKNCASQLIHVMKSVSNWVDRYGVLYKTLTAPHVDVDYLTTLRGAELTDLLDYCEQGLQRVEVPLVDPSRHPVTMMMARKGALKKLMKEAKRVGIDALGDTSLLKQPIAEFWDFGAPYSARGRLSVPRQTQ